MEAWDAIQCAFPQNNYCSRVMITTRNEKLAERCCGTSRGIICNMNPLSVADSRKLFFTRIFGSEDDCPPEFEEVSCAILKRCGGLPLAIITIAGILASQQTKLKEAWEYIQNALAPELETNIDYEKMMYILDLSYKHLPLPLKSCFLYLGTYPEDHVIGRVELVRRWVAEGFVSNSAGLNVWDVAESYFNELVNRSMVQPAWSFLDEESMSGCRVHDMMLDLILRKCKEDNFLVLVNDPHEVAAGTDKVIRRLTIDLKGVEDDKMAMTSVGNLSHLRSLTLFTGQMSNWIPLLLELKFVRVLFFSVGWYKNQMDLFGIINQLSHLRYLEVGGGEGRSSNAVVPTHQIKGLQFLETLDLSQLGSYMGCFVMKLDLVDLPRLSHLSVRYGHDSGLPRGIGDMKQLRTLSGFDLGHSSLESVIGLGELTALSELSLVCSSSSYERWPPRTVWKPIWMAALSTSLEKLDNLKLFGVSPPNEVALCADTLSSLSPTWAGSLEQLHLKDWTFSAIPRWISHLPNLKELSLGAKQIIQEDIGIIGILHSLIRLHLRIVHVPTIRIVIGGGLFTSVKRFAFDCDGISSLTFEPGAMRNLRELGMAINIDDWDRATPEGLQHLEGLQKITVTRTNCRSDYDSRDDEADAALIRSVFQDTVDGLPTRPVFTYNGENYCYSDYRPVEWDELEEDPCIQAVHNT